MNTVPAFSADTHFAKERLLEAFRGHIATAFARTQAQRRLERTEPPTNNQSTEGEML